MRGQGIENVRLQPLTIGSRGEACGAAEATRTWRRARCFQLLQPRNFVGRALECGLVALS